MILLICTMCIIIGNVSSNFLKFSCRSLKTQISTTTASLQGFICVKKINMKNVRELEATIALLEVMVKTGRAKKEELAAAKSELVALSSPTPIASTPNSFSAPVRKENPANLQNSNVEKVFLRKGELMSEILNLSHRQNELSNRLHQIDDDTPCPGLTREILELRYAIEERWSEYRFIERNGILPAHKTADEIDPDNELKLLKIATELRSLRDKRLKLEKKLEKPHLNTKNPIQKVPEWQEELAKVKADIASLEFEKEQLS